MEQCLSLAYTEEGIVLSLLHRDLQLVGRSLAAVSYKDSDNDEDLVGKWAVHPKQKDEADEEALQSWWS